MVKKKNIEVNNNNLNIIKNKTNITKSINYNFSNRIEFYNNIKLKLQNEIRLKDEIEKEYLQLENNSVNRLKRADLRIKLETFKNKEKELKKIELEEIDYIHNISKVINYNNDFKDNDEDDEEDIITNENNSNNDKLTKSKSSFESFNLKQFFQEKTNSENVQCIELAKLLHEIPLEQSEIKYCPFCPGNIILEYFEKPPSLTCSKCGLFIDDIDITSPNVHEKEISNHLPFVYRPIQHFDNWIRRITGKNHYIIPDDILDEIYREMCKRKIEFDNINWTTVDEILRNLAKRKNPKFKDYYQHVYQITNLIRGSPMLIISEEIRNILLDMFKIIYDSWNRIKDKNRSNFMSNAFVLQMCFSLLGCQPEVIGMFNTLKGSENLNDYARISEMICKENDWDWSKVKNSVLSNNLLHSKNNLFDSIKMNNNKNSIEEDEDDNPFV